MKEIKLKVVEALQEESYKGIVRIDAGTMKEIGVKPGDIIEIEGGRKTVGIVDRAYPTDVGQAVIRMDSILRRNAETSLEEYIVVKKAEIKEAKSITIAPSQESVFVQADPNLFKRGLLGRAVVKGDQVALGGFKGRRRTFSGSPFEDIFNHLFDDENSLPGFGFNGLKFIIVSTDPKQAVIITGDTQIKLNPKAKAYSDEDIKKGNFENIIPNSKLIYVKKFPEIKSLIEVKNILEIEKLSKIQIMNFYEDNNKKIYFTNTHYFLYKK